MKPGPACEYMLLRFRSPDLDIGGVLVPSGGWDAGACEVLLHTI